MTTPPRGMFVTRLTCQEPDCTAELQEWPGSEPLRAKERGWRETFGYWRCPQHATGTAPSAVPPRAHFTTVNQINATPPHVSAILRRAAAHLNQSVGHVRAAGVTWCVGHTDAEIVDVVTWIREALGPLPDSPFEDPPE